MSLDRAAREKLVRALAESVIQHADELTSLDQAIGDGDHGLNMKRGFEAVLATLPGLADKSLPEMLKAIGMTLVMKVGGASGPLVGTFFMELGKALPEQSLRADLVAATAKAIDAVKARGRSEAGQKTLLDVLVPVQVVLAGGGDAKAIAAEAAQAADRTTPMLAIRGRASFLGERSIGHMGPWFAFGVPFDRRGSQGTGIRGKFMNSSNSGNVGIVIVSHSPKIAEGAADMVRQMVGSAVPLAWTGGDIDGGLGTNVAGILEAIETAWSPAGVAVLVDLGGAETNSEMAVEMLPEDRRARVVVCNAPVVEGAVIAATESSGGSPLAAVKRSAEEFYA
ncbi:dihydroxyacetone kinase phosphoprotein-dependent L subunit [Bradyrhizobium sp. LM2.7]